MKNPVTKPIDFLKDQYKEYKLSLWHSSISSMLMLFMGVYGYYDKWESVTIYVSFGLFVALLCAFILYLYFYIKIRRDLREYNKRVKAGKELLDKIKFNKL